MTGTDSNMVLPPSAQVSPGAAKPSPSAWFTAEIQQMMHGFGDCRKPQAESAALIEEIVHSQMITLLHQAAEVASMRNGRFIGIEDFLFLLRKDKVKLRRLIKVMELKDMKAAIYKSSALDEEDSSEQAESKQAVKKKRKICYDFLSSIDQTGELLTLFDDDNSDEVKLERCLRAELRTRHMDAQQYLDFCQARQASFSPRYKSQKFKDWMMQGVSNLEIKPNPHAIEVLSYLAYETVAQIVDLALLVRHDQRSMVDDPFAQVMPPVCVNHDNALGPLQAQGSMSGKSPSRSGSPSNTPPSTPTTPTPGAGGPIPSATTPTSQGVLNTSGTTSSSSKKSKKRKKSGSQTSRDLSQGQAIQPRDIREAMRRFGQNIGPFADFYVSKQQISN